MSNLGESVGKKSPAPKSYIIRDVLVWVVLIVVLPMVIVSMYFLVIDRRAVAQDVSPTSVKSPMDERLMRYVSLGNYSDAVCNDGSAAGFYVRLSTTNSKRWIILLEGGYFCYDQASCLQRRENSFNLTSSLHNRAFRLGKGILSSSQSENKHWSDANLVSLPYCSSDLWIGNRKTCSQNCSATQDFNFMGQRIIDSLMDHLLEVHSLDTADSLIFVGQSAGGIGVLMNVNRISQRIAHSAPQLRLKAIVDSSWQLELPYSFLCDNLHSDDCLISKIFLNSINYWNAQLPNECLSNIENKWDCFLPYKMVSFINVPVFFVQSLFDETLMIEQFTNGQLKQQQARAVNEQLNYLNLLRHLRDKIRHTLKTTNAYFVPACTAHMILSRSDWNTFRVGKHSLSDVLDCWARERGAKDGCHFRLIENCTWPDCASTCPPLKHPDTDKLVNPLEYFSYFGLVNIRELSLKLKVSEFSLRQMNYLKLMKLIVKASRKRLL